MSRADPETDAVEAVKQLSLLESTLLRNRTLTIFGEINKDVAQRTAEKLLAVAFERDDPITIFICSPGGHVESGDAIFDMIRFVKPIVRIVGTGWVGSAATHIYLATEREHRYALPNTRFLIHQPAGGLGGDATDIQIQAKEIIKTRERINRIIAEQTGQPLERVAEDTDRDHWMSAEESVAYGIVGKIIRSAAELG
ncbi:MAG TPA: ATP-dependent Clp protease proteolytic subunit [Myxococcota bacterium]|nr:ATP-dependent Clp protease proteolytic subunit [Myxococcota bacterium]